MLRKIFLTVSALAMLTAVSAASAGNVTTFPVYPVTGSIKVKGTEQTNTGATKIFSGTGTNQKLIRMAMGGDADVAVANEKNLVLGYVSGDSPLSCEAQVVVWNKVTLAVVGLVAHVSSCYGANTQAAAPAEGKAGTRIFLQNARFYFENNTQDNCSSLNHNQLSGEAYAIGEYSSKRSAQGIGSPQKFKFTHLLGDVKIAGDEFLNVIDGTFTATFTKTLGTTTASLTSACP